jgi:hypothetical protein
MTTPHLLISSELISPELVSAGCPEPPAGTERDPATRLGCAVSGVGDWLSTAPGRLVDLAAQWWPLLLAGVLVVLAVVLAVRAGYRRLWRREVRAGYWVRLTPPRVLDVAQAADVWRLLAGLARRARTGRHLTRPPLAFEVYGDGAGQLVAGLWLPRWVPLATVTAEAERAWPGVRVEPTAPPLVADGDGWRVAGCRLAATGSDLVPLTDDPPTGGRRPVRGPGTDGDPLRPVLAALARRDGPAVLQVLARPASGRRLAALGHAARYGVKARKRASVRAVDALSAVLSGALRLLLDLITDLVSTGRSASSSYTNRGGGAERHRPADPVAARAMREAAGKLADGPHLLATLRVAVARTDAGFAATAARSLADGFITASTALAPVRLRRAAVKLADRWAGRGDWLLLSATELGVLAHLPADPARYGFDTAALHRAHPTTARRATPERGSPRGPGWTRRGWTHPTDTTGIDAPDAVSGGWKETL